MIVKTGLHRFSLALLCLALRLVAEAQPTDSLAAALATAKGADRVALSLTLASAYAGKDWEKSVVFAQQSLETARALRNDSLIFESSFMLSKSLLGMGDNQQALGYARDAVTLAFDSASRVSAIGHLGSVHEQRAEYEQALQNYLAAMAIHQARGDVRGEANMLNNMSFVYKGMGQFDKAIAVLRQAGKLYVASGNANREAGTKFNIGLMKMEMKEYDTAIAYFRTAVRGLNETAEPVKFSSYYNNLANCFEAMMKQNPAFYDSALRYGKKNLALKKQLNDHRGIANAHNTLAAIYERSESYTESYMHASAALRLADSLNLKRIKKNALDYLITAEIGLRKFDALNAHFVAFTRVTEELNKEAHSRTLAELNTKYESEKKEAENQRLLLVSTQQTRLNWILGTGGLVLLVLLGFLGYYYRGSQQANRQLAVQNKQIENNLREKEALLREIHHRVKNNLQVISSLLNMQSHYLDDPRMVSAITEGQNRVKAMALIHQKLYQTEQLSEIDFQEYAEQLLAHLSSALSPPGKKISNSVTGTAIKLDIDTAIPLGLILNELITNAYKYAFEGVSEGTLKVELQRDETALYHLRISDSGRGLPADFSESKLNSLGLKLVRMLIEQLEGSLTISNEPGASFYIRFKETRLTA